MDEATLRAEFPVCERYAFLNHAAVGPLSRRARDKILAWAEDSTIHGSVHGAAWWAEVEETRRGAAKLLSADAAEIAFVGNTSCGLATIAEGFPWREGDAVVVPASDYPSNEYPWMQLADRGVALRPVPTTDGRFTLEDLDRAIDGRTRLVAVSHVHFASGWRCDLDAVGRLCRDRGVDLCVDAIQGLGILPIDVARTPIDYLAADGHKWLLAPEGAGVLFVRREKIAKIRPPQVGWKSVVGKDDYSTIDFRLREDATRFEPGSFNVVGIVALGASLSLLDELGQSYVRDRIKSRTDYLVSRLASVGIKVASPRDGDQWSGIVSFSPLEGSAMSALARCRRAGVVVATRAGRLRVSPHVYNNEADIDRLIAILAEPAAG